MICFESLFYRKNESYIVVSAMTNERQKSNFLEIFKLVIEFSWVKVGVKL